MSHFICQLSEGMMTYMTPDGKKFKTQEQAQRHARKLLHGQQYKEKVEEFAMQNTSIQFRSELTRILTEKKREIWMLTGF